MSRRLDGTPPDHPEAGFSMIATMVSLVAVALLTLLLMSTTLKSGSTSATNVANAPGVGQADNLLAQQSLSTALTAVSTAASANGGYGSLDIGSLSASDPSVSFVTGPTTSASTVSIAVTSTGDGASGAGAASPSSGSIGSAISGAEAAGGTGASASSGSVTLTAHSSDGICWLVWRSSGSATWFGAQTGQSSCTAPALAAAPVAGPVTSTSIGWQQGGFPSA